MKYKDYIIDKLKGRTVRFTSDCMLKLDVEGTIIDAYMDGSEIIYVISTDTGLKKVGENTPRLNIFI